MLAKYLAFDIYPWWRLNQRSRFLHAELRCWLQKRSDEVFMSWQEKKISESAVKHRKQHQTHKAGVFLHGAACYVKQELQRSNKVHCDLCHTARKPEVRGHMFWPPSTPLFHNTPNNNCINWKRKRAGCHCCFFDSPAPTGLAGFEFGVGGSESEDLWTSYDLQLQNR